MREMQTRLYDSVQATQVQKAVFDVLQDDGYVVKNAEPSLGLLTAVKEVSISSRRDGSTREGINFGAGFGFGPYGFWGEPNAQEQWPALEVVESSVNVTPFGKGVKVRVIFQKRILNNFGGPVSSTMIDDLNFYQSFFSKVDKSLYLLREKL